MTSLTPADADRIRTVGAKLRTGLGTLTDLAAQADPATRLLILQQLWTGHGGHDSAVDSLADLLAALAAELDPVEFVNAVEEAGIVLTDTVAGDHIERAQILLAATVAAEHLVPLIAGTAAGAGVGDLVTGPVEEDQDHEEEHETIRYTADVVCIRDGDIPAVLLIERRWEPYTGLLALPGGHVDRGETSSDAAVRELLEETGVEVSPFDLDLVGIYDAPGRDPRGRYVSVAYVVQVPENTEALAGDDASAVRWVPLADLPDELAFDHSSILADGMR